MSALASRLSPPRGGRTFRSLRQHRNYRLWFTGQVISVSGTWVQNVAQQWFIVTLTHSPLALGLLAVFQFTPYSLLGLLGGSFVDRLDNRHTLMVTQSALMVSSLVLASLALSGHAMPWEVYGIAAFDGFVNILDNPSRQAFTIQMVGRDELPNAVALNSSLFNTSRVIGPAIGGLLIASAGVGVCFIVNSMSFLAVLAALWRMNPRELHTPSRGPRTSLYRSTSEGMAFARRQPDILQPLLLMLVISTVGINFNIWMPILAKQTLHAGPATFGWLSAAFGIGALIGALTSATLGRSSRRLLLVGAAGFALAECVLALSTTLVACLAVLVLTGVAFTTYASMSNSTLQLATPDALRGRVMGLYSWVFMGTAPIGGLVVGWLATLGGTRLSIGTAGLICLAAAGVAIAVHVRPRLRSATPPIAPVVDEVSMVRE